MASGDGGYSGPATAMARSPSVDLRVAGTIRSDEGRIGRKWGTCTLADTLTDLITETMRIFPSSLPSLLILSAPASK